MYSRYHDPSERPIQIPENYGGSAFSNRRFSAPEEGRSEPMRRIDVAKPTPLAEKTVPPGMAPPKPILLPPPREEHKKEAAEPTDRPVPNEKPPVPASPSALQAPLGTHTNGFPFSHGIGFDELLIMGLILLLSRSGQESDLILWLMLLLFCG